MAAWVTVDVTVSGTASGTENVYSRQLTLDYDAQDAAKEESRPWDSPFGVDAETDANQTTYTTKSVCAMNGITFPL